MREHDESLNDRRKNLGVPLRKSRASPSAFQGISSASEWVYEAHFAFALTGINHRFWTAYCFVDTHFDSRDSVKTYHKMNGDPRGTADPLAAGFLHSESPIWEPRQYFAKVVEFRIRLIEKEWNKIIEKMERDIAQYVHILNFPRFSTGVQIVTSLQFLIKTFNVL
jgi:hypothetical protein